MQQVDSTVSQSPQPQRGSIGILIAVSSPPLAEMLSAIGFDFLFLDLEHGGISYSDLQSHVIASRVPSFVRLPDCSEVAVKHAADTGAASLVVPHVSTSRMAADIVRWAHYPPVGERSVGLSRNTLLGYDLAEALKRTDQPSL